MVTRGGQITLTKDVREKLGVREGDTIVINIVGKSAFFSKKDINAFDNGDFLPEKFSKILEAIRKKPVMGRLRKLGIIE